MTKLTSIWFIHRQFSVTPPPSIKNSLLWLEKEFCYLTIKIQTGVIKVDVESLDHRKLIEQIGSSYDHINSQHSHEKKIYNPASYISKYLDLLTCFLSIYLIYLNLDTVRILDKPN